MRLCEADPLSAAKSTAILEYMFLAAFDFAKVMERFGAVGRRLVKSD